MADKLYKVGEVIDLSYQAPNKQSGLTGVVAEIFLPNKQKDSNFPDVVLTEDMANTGTYVGDFTPDQQGTWRVLMHKSDGDGQVGKSFSIGGHNVHSVGEAVGTVDGKVDTVNSNVGGVKAKTDNLPDDPASTTGVNTAKTDILDAIDTLDDKVSALDTPPMAF